MLSAFSDHAFHWTRSPIGASTCPRIIPRLENDSSDQNYGNLGRPSRGALLYRIAVPLTFSRCRFTFEPVRLCVFQKNSSSPRFNFVAIA